MGIGERIHSPLRRSYLKLRQEHPNMSKDLLLDAAVKAHNDTSGVNGLVPTFLVYGSFPRLQIRDENIDSPSNSERASMRSLAMAEYSKAIDELRLKLTENAQSPTVPVGLLLNDLVLVWKKPLKKWDGPLPLISETPVVFYIRDRRGVSIPYAKTSVKLYREGIRVEHLLPPQSDQIAGDQLVLGENDIRLPEDIDEVDIQIPLSRPAPEPPDIDNEGLGAKFDPEKWLAYAESGELYAMECHASHLVSTTGGVYDPSDHAIDLSKSGHDNAKEDVNILFALPWNRSTAEHDDLKQEIMSTEVLSPAAPRRSALGTAIETENEGLRKNMVFEKVKIPQDRRSGLNILRSRYILAYKRAGTRE
jgi:hypothetical protein